MHLHLVLDQNSILTEHSVGALRARVVLSSIYGVQAVVPQAYVVAELDFQETQELGLENVSV